MPRIQNPSLRSKGTKAYWFVQVWLPAGESGKRRRHEHNLGWCPTSRSAAVRRLRGELTKAEAERKRRHYLEWVNSLAEQPLNSQMRVGDFVDGFWIPNHLPNLGEGTKKKYLSHLENHILPAFRSRRLAEVDVITVQRFMAGLRLGWWARADCLNILSSVFSKAELWGLHEGRNPTRGVKLGPKIEVREKVILSDIDEARLIAELAPHASLIFRLERWCGVRVSEALGLEWEHVDLDAGWIAIRQRWCRGALGPVKSQRARRELPLGSLAEEFRRIYSGELVLPRSHKPGNLERPPKPDAFIFDRGDGQPYDDRALLAYHFRPAAKKLGIHFPGFGHHSNRRKAITTLQEEGASAFEIQRFAGHAKGDVTTEYTLLRRQKMEAMVRSMQERGSAAGSQKVITFDEARAAGKQTAAANK